MPPKRRSSYASKVFSQILLGSAFACSACSGDGPPDTTDAATHTADADAAGRDVDAGRDDTDGSSPDSGDSATLDGATDADPGDAPVDSEDSSDAGTALCVPSDGTTGGVRDFAVGGWQIELHDDGRWSVIPPHGGDAVLAAPPACEDRGGEPVAALRLGRGEPLVNNQFGAFRIELESARSDVVWSPISGGAPSVEEGDDQVALTWPLADGTANATLRFVLTESDLSVRLDSDDDTVSAGEIVLGVAADDAFFGLGTQVTGMDLRGGTYPLWTQEQGIEKVDPADLFPLENIPEAAYAPMGIWHSSAGYGAVVGHDAYSEIDLGESHAERVALRSYPVTPSFVLVAGETPRDRLTAITAYTGRTTAPPPWVFAPWNDAVGGPDHLRAVAARLREADIPSSAIWAEDWIGGEQTGVGYRLSYAWEWDEEVYPNLPEDIATLHADGFAFLAYFNPFVPQPTRMWTEGVEGRFLLARDDGSVRTVTDPAFRTAGLVDLTNPDAVAWLRGYQERAAGELGVDGWMADFAEWAPVDAVPADGQSAWAHHNRYPMLWQQANREAIEAVHEAEDAPNDWTFFVRSGWASVNGGTGGIAPLMWGGDQNTDWGYSDGYPTVLPIAAHVGLSGVPIFGSDIAGYTSVVSDNTDKELFYRWASMGAFHPLMRTHHGSDECGNWAFDRDDETLAHYRRYAVIHTLLFPYFVSLLPDAVDRGLPLTRHPYLVEPEARSLWTGDGYEVFLGDDLLVAPVLEQGAASRTVFLPAAGWWPLFGDAPIEGAGGDADTVEVEVDAPPTEIPVFVRPGTALPLLAEPVDSFYGAAADDVTTLADVEERHRVALYPDAAGSIRTTRVGSGTVSGDGWWPAPNGTPTVDDVALGPCDGAEDDESCWDEGAGLVRIVGAAASLAWNEATLEVSGDHEQTLVVGVAADAWGDLAEPTVLTDLDPDIPPPCEEE